MKRGEETQARDPEAASRKKEDRNPWRGRFQSATPGRKKKLRSGLHRFAGEPGLRRQALFERRES